MCGFAAPGRLGTRLRLVCGKLLFVGRWATPLPCWFVPAFHLSARAESLREPPQSAKLTASPKGGALKAVPFGEGGRRSLTEGVSKAELFRVLTVKEEPLCHVRDISPFRGENILRA